MAFQLALGVTPESLKHQSTVVSGDIDAMEKQIFNMQQEIEGMRNYWKGDAHDSMDRKFAEQMEQFKAMITRLRTYPTRILQMAGLYEQTEDVNEQIATSTQTDIQMR